MKLLVSFFDIVQWIFIYGSLVFAIVFLLKIIINKKTKSFNVRGIIAMVLCSIYVIAFIMGKVFFEDLFDMIASCLFIIILIVTNQWAKYEDRVNGLRGWYR